MGHASAADPPSKKTTKLTKENACKKKLFFHRTLFESEPQSGSQNRQNGIPISFLHYRKFRMRFSSRFCCFQDARAVVPNTIIFAMRPFLKTYINFYKTISKLVPLATPLAIRNRKKLIFTTVENYVFFCYKFEYSLSENPCQNDSKLM